MDIQTPIIGLKHVDEKQHYVNDGADGVNSLKNSADDVSSGQLDHISPIDERNLTARLDFKVIPILGLLYLICFLDRTNIANARIAGMEKGLHFPKKGYNTALWIFYLPFVLAEIPLNMLMATGWIKPNFFLGVQTFLLGMFFLVLFHSY